MANDGFGGIGPAECPSIHALSSPGGFDLPADFTYDDGSDYEEEDVAEEDVSDGYAFEDRSLEFEMRLFQPPAFAAVSTPGELRRALRRGVNHIVLIQHMDLIDAKTEPDLPRQMEALDNAVGRVLNTTLSIVVRPSHTSTTTSLQATSAQARPAVLLEISRCIVMPHRSTACAAKHGTAHMRTAAE